MDATTITRISALGRIVVGSSLVAAPALLGRPWVGSAAEAPETQVYSAAMGARDVAIGAGQLVSAAGDPRPWLLAATVADAADLLATLRAREHLPALGVAGVALMAGSAIVTQLWLAAQSSRA